MFKWLRWCSVVSLFYPVLVKDCGSNEITSWGSVWRRLERRFASGNSGPLTGFYALYTFILDKFRFQISFRSFPFSLFCSGPLKIFQPFTAPLLEQGNLLCEMRSQHTSPETCYYTYLIHSTESDPNFLAVCIEMSLVSMDNHNNRSV